MLTPGRAGLTFQHADFSSTEHNERYSWVEVGTAEVTKALHQYKQRQAHHQTGMGRRYIPRSEIVHLIERQKRQQEP